MRKDLKGETVAIAPRLAVLVLLLSAAGCGEAAAGAALPRAVELPLWCFLAAAAALHRPLGGAGLGLGTLVVPAAFGRLGVAGAVLVAGVARLLVAAFRHSAVRRARGGEKLGHGLVAAAVTAAAAAAAATLATSRLLAEAGFVWRALLPATVYVLSFTAIIIVVGKLRIEGLRDRWPAADVTGIAALSLDAGGWLVGTLLADAAVTLGWPRVTMILTVLALLAAEAARNAIARGASDHRVGDFERLHQAHERILGETSGMGAVAQQILIECSNILPAYWFQLELAAPEKPGQLDLEPRGWSAGPDGALVEAEPQPEPRPPMLPGVHRRTHWRILEAPLVVEGERLAVVRLWCDPRQVEPGAEELFATLVPQMASSVHRARLDREARLDPLTGVPVRRLLEGGLQRAFRRRSEDGGSLAVIMCDIDYFKQVNDTYGHAAGDDALILVARALEGERREGDLLCRYGGEEFTLLLDDTSGPAALRLAERLRRRVEEIDLAFEGRAIPLTLSAGVAAFPELHIKTASELLLLADEALYEAKETGRNRCLLNLGRGTFGSVAGETIGTRTTPAKAPPRIFG